MWTLRSLSEFEQVYTSPGDGDAGFEFQRPAWQSQAACRGLGPDWFYVDDSRGKYDWDKITPLCRECPVHQPCYEYALVHEEDGVWAGTSRNDRRLHRKVLQIRLDVPGGSSRDLSDWIANDKPVCGTEAGFQRHLRAGAQPCDKCRLARNLGATERKRGASRVS